MHHERAHYFPLSIFSLAVLALLSGCGGGGGGSQNPGNTTLISTQPGTSPAPISSAYNPSDPSNVAAAHARGITGAGVTVGIVDTDFDVTDPELAGRVSKAVYTPASGGSSGGFLGQNGNGNMHGTDVAEILGGKNVGIAPGVQMLGVAAGEGTDGVVLSAAIYNFLYNSGVKIFNQSVGVGTIASPSDSGTYYNIYQPFVAKGGLFVWATGNGGAAQPSLTAGLPSLYPDLQKGWIAVTAVNAVGGAQAYSNADTVPGSIASYANRCGVAANWCLAAPGDFVSPSAGERVYGTSFAAPAVTGAVALVQQVYPWMNADLLRQTILSTATSMGDTATYGWGLLNASKAVNGPALFAQSLALGPNVNVSFDTVSSTFSNAIAGDAGLVKSGTGTLTLSGANRYSGNNEVANGTLNITGSITSGVQIDASGNLSGNGGRIGGNVTNNGRLSNTGAGLAIAGNYTASVNAVLANDINATLIVGGTATLGGSHLVATVPAGNADANAYVTAQANSTPQKVVTAGTAVLNTFSDVGFQSVGTAFPPLLNAQLTYGPKEVDLTIGRVATTVAAQTFAADPTRTNTAANVEQAMTAADTMVANGQTGGNNATLVASAAALERVANVAALGAALDSLSGQIHASAQALTFQQSQAVNRTLSSRLSQLGMQDTQLKTGLWVSAIGASGKLNETGYASADTSTLGGQFGIDTQLNDKTIVGASVAYSDSHASFDRFGGNSKSQNTGVSLYGRYALNKENADNALNGGGYIAGRAGIATVSSTVNRTAIAGTEIENLQADHTDNMFSAYAEYGYATKLSRYSLVTPFIGVAYDRLKRGGFAESGGSFGLTANSQSYQQTAGIAGVRGQTTVDWFAGKSVLQAYAAWQHAFSSGNLNFSAGFTGAPGSQFTVEGISLARNSGWVGVGLSTAINRQWSWYANVDGQFSRGGAANSVLSLGVRIGFD
ncbi:autotransporter serine protease [Glaciimonas sp. PCH181]|uniref:autotransporter serine protease n=1 Tax=Glaciimonas sp. PCH181 TaxID=2133943 RepID=UPI000D378930|nr:autotransporter serine protease [Glaciimonas sp. PCH181]PUA16635.1 peptidase S8 [Glaciimonas sp. PCH181]